MGVSTASVKGRSWLKTLWSETMGRRYDSLRKGEGTIPTARSLCHQTNHNIILCCLSSKTFAGLGSCKAAHVEQQAAVLSKRLNAVEPELLCFVEKEYYNACLAHMGGHWRRKGCDKKAKSDNRIILWLETKPDKPDLSHTKLYLIHIGCMRVGREGQ